MTLGTQERKELRILLVVVAGFLAGLALLFFVIATDL
jgi:preprotein translocase subunit SecE